MSVARDAALTRSDWERHRKRTPQRIGGIRARAIAYDSSRDDKHYQDLEQWELEEFWAHVMTLRNTHRVPS